MYMDLCSRKLTDFIKHPRLPGEKLFFLVDHIDNQKNIFNVFVNKVRMHVPTNKYKQFIGQSCITFFSHVKRLYALEENKPLKIAHTLKKASLNPSNIDRTSPQHALSK